MSKQDIKVTVARADFMPVISRIARLIERKNTIPILSNVLIEASGDKLSLRGTDLDIELSNQCAAKVDASGATTVPAQLLSDIVRRFPEGGDIVFEQDTDRNSITVKSGRSRFKLNTLPPVDYPEILGREVEHSFVLAKADLIALIHGVAFAISTEETRYYLNGIYLHPNKGDDGKPKLRGVATDGHRLSRYDLPMVEGAEKIPGVIVPRKTVAQLDALLSASTEADVFVEMSAGRIRFVLGDTALTSKLIDGTFPDYSRVIPTGNNKTAILSRADFAETVERVSTVSSERGRAVKFNFAQGKLNASVTNPDSGTAEEEIEVDFDADPLEIGFNSRYIADIMKVIAGEKVTLALADPGSPTILKGDDAKALYVLMPMRV